MKALERERLARLGSRLDGLLTPRLEHPVTSLEDVDRMDWELWLLVILVLLMLALAFLLNHFPELVGSVRAEAKPVELETYLDGFAILVLIFTVYVIQKHRQLVRVRRDFFDSRIEQAGLEHRLDLVRVLFGLGTLVTSRAARGPSYEDVLAHLGDVMEADHTSLWLSETPGGDLLLDAQRGDRLYAAGARQEHGKGLIGWVAEQAEPFLLDEGSERTFPGDGEGPDGRLRAAMVVPLTVHGDVLGVLLVGITSGIQRYGQPDVQLLQVFAGILAASHRTGALVNELKQSLKRNEETQMRLLQAEKLAALGELMAGISHELNNPLSVIVGQSELLMEQDVSEDVSRRLMTVQQEATRAKQLIENLLRVARGGEPRRERVRLDEVVRQSVALLRYQLDTDSITIFEDHPDELPLTHLDPFAVQQMVFNLVNNARQALQEMDPSRRSLVIGTRLLPDGPPDGHGPSPALHLFVKDTGPGIPPEHLHRIFEPFFTTKGIGRGTGLGLSICYRAVREHGGRVEASNEPDGGARFDIWIPAENVSPEPAEPAGLSVSEAPIPITAGEATILVVDDERKIQELLAEALGLIGHRVVGAYNGKEALRLLKGTRPDVIVLDLKMPIMDGQTFFAHLKEDHPDLVRRVFFLTGDTLSRDARTFLEFSGRPYLSKPFTLQSLRDAVNGVLREAD